MVTAMFAGFEEPDRGGARKRWFASAGTSLAVYVVVGAGLLVLARQTVAKSKEEPPLEVTFQPAPAAPEPAKVETAPPPPPPPRATGPKPKRPGKAAPTNVSKIPDARPEESSAVGELAPGVPEEYGDGEGGEPVAPTPPAPPPPPPEVEAPPAPPPPPIDEPEVVVAPTPLPGNTLPAYPDAARRAGRQGDVILKVRISDTGEVVAVELIRGDEPFASAAIAAVRTWRYRPATIDGRPSPYTRRVQIPFRIRS